MLFLHHLHLFILLYYMPSSNSSDGVYSNASINLWREGYISHIFLSYLELCYKLNSHKFFKDFHVMILIGFIVGAFLICFPTPQHILWSQCFLDLTGTSHKLKNPLWLSVLDHISSQFHPGWEQIILFVRASKFCLCSFPAHIMWSEICNIQWYKQSSGIWVDRDQVYAQLKRT